MYIPFDKIAATIALFSPLKAKKFIRHLGESAKIKQNVKYIEKNQKKVIKKLKNKFKKEKIRVAFSCYDSAKWKCESLYQLFLKSEDFHPFIIVTKNSANPKVTHGGISDEDFNKTVDFFKNKGFETYLGYNLSEKKHIPTEKFKPDLIFYQNPWYNVTCQGPVVTSKFALSFYVPYFLATSFYKREWCMRFHQYIFRHYVLDENVKKHYADNMLNKGKNLKVVGHTMLDYFYLNKDKEYEDKNYVIYAPHWSCDVKSSLQWGTFLWNGKFMLEYAKSHPEFNWIFKPHSTLKKRLKIAKDLSDEQIEEYWTEWGKIGKVVETGDYIDMFMESKLMVCDCGSFETEYLFTKKPLIHPESRNNPIPFNKTVEKIVNSYYRVKTTEELKQTLDEVLIKGNDYKKQERLKVMEEVGFHKIYAAQNIYEDIVKVLS